MKGSNMQPGPLTEQRIELAGCIQAPPCAGGREAGRRQPEPEGEGQSQPQRWASSTKLWAAPSC